MAKHRTPDQLRDMIRRGMTNLGHEVTPELEQAMADIPEREARPKPESRGMSEQAMIRIRNDEIAWFKSHPGEREYIRRMVPGEFPPDVTAAWVKVIKLTPDANERVREPVIRVLGKAGFEWHPWKGVDDGASVGNRTR